MIVESMLVAANAGVDWRRKTICSHTRLLPCAVKTTDSVMDKSNTSQLLLVFDTELAGLHRIGNVTALAEQARDLARDIQLKLEARSATQAAENQQLIGSVLSVVSHDLKGPFGTISGAAAALLQRKDKIRADELTEVATAICGEASRVQKLLEDLGDAANFTAEGLCLKLAPVSG
jgi:K+-sensing histidine kinase KdpD